MNESLVENDRSSVNISFTLSSCIVGDRITEMHMNTFYCDDGLQYLKAACLQQPFSLFIASIDVLTLDVLRRLAAISEHKPTAKIGMIGAHVQLDECGAVFRLGLGENAVIRLRNATQEEATQHLIAIIEKERNSHEVLRKEHVELERSYSATKAELEKMRDRSTWHEKEMSLLRMLIPSSTRRATTSESYGDIGAQHNSGCSCQNTDCSCSASAHISKVLDSEDLSMIDVESINTDTINTDTSRSSSPGKVHATRKPDELLWGVAQYILCQLCPGFQAADVKMMEDHLLRTHVDHEKKNCSACPAEEKPNLVQHMRQHMNRVYACEFCGKRGRKHFLKAHVKTHSGEKPFLCEECGRNFSDGSTLRRHRLVHSGEKKHTCPICGRGIARKDNVKIHIKSHGIDVDTDSL